MMTRKGSPTPYLNKVQKQASKYDQSKHSQLNSLQLFIHPSKKKLVISDLSTPKETPSKNITTRKNHNHKGQMTTNVNVYVNAVHRSKSKDSTPCRDKQKTKRVKHTTTILDRL